MKRLGGAKKKVQKNTREGSSEVEFGQLDFGNPLGGTFDVEDGASPTWSPLGSRDTANVRASASDSKNPMDVAEQPGNTVVRTVRETVVRTVIRETVVRETVVRETTGTNSAGRVSKFELPQEPELTDDELSDLAFAFQACDADEDGWIEVGELRAIFVALGAEVTETEVQELVADAKSHFREWLQEHVQGDDEFPEMMLYNGAEPGHHGDTKHGGQRHFHLPNVGKPVEKLRKSGQLVKQVTDAAPLATPLKTGLKTGVRSSANLGKFAVKSGIRVGGKSLGKVVMNTPVFNRAFKHGQNTVVARIDESDASADDKMILVSATLGGQDIEAELAAAMEDPNKLIYAEYVLMATGNLWTKYVKTDWHKMAWKMRLLRNCYDTADVDGLNQLNQEKLEMVMFALDQNHGLTHDDITYLWMVLNPDKKPSLTFADYLHGMGHVAKDPKCHDWIDIARPNQWELLSLIIDTPHSEAEDVRLLEGLSWLERSGIQLLKTMKTPMEMEHMRTVLNKLGRGELRTLEPEQFRRMRVVHLECVLACACAGFVFTALPALVENYLLSMLETDGLVDAYWVCTNISSASDSSSGLTADGMTPAVGYASECRIEPVDEIACPPGVDGLNIASGAEDTCGPCGGCMACSCPADLGRLIDFWLWNTLAVIVCVIFEIAFLMYFCARFCVKVGWALDFRLVPLNVDRVFVADSLVRAAFELGNPDSVIMGVDPHAESSATGNLRSVIALLLYKGKVIVQSALHKFILVRLTHPSFYMLAKPWIGTCAATVMWDALVSHTIMSQAELRGFGVYTSVELFNEVLKLHYPDVKEIPEQAKIQIVRAVGVAIVKQGNMYPTLEMLLRHAIQYLGLRGKEIVSESGTLDSEEHFLSEMVGLDDECKTVVLSIHLLGHMLTGALNRAKKACWHHVVDAAGPSVACQYSSTHMQRLSFLCWRFRHYEVITADDLHKCFEPNSEEEVPPHHYFTECCYRCACAVHDQRLNLCLTKVRSAGWCMCVCVCRLPLPGSPSA